MLYPVECLFPEELSEREKAIAKKIPGLVGLDRRRVRNEIRNPFSLVRGELSRLCELARRLEREERELTLLRTAEEVKTRLLQRKLHSFYDADSDPLAPYDLGDFDQSLALFQLALRDVGEMYEYLSGVLPENIVFDGRDHKLHSMVRDPFEVELCRDPIELIRLARRGGRERAPRVSHAARMRLVLGQIFMEYRRYGFDPAQLEGRAKKTSAALEDRLFVRGSKKRVRIVAGLDPARAYTCQSCEIVENPDAVIVQRLDRFVMEADRYLVEDSDGVFPVFFWIRPKRFPGLKSIVKDTRFAQIANIGDGVAMRFVVMNENDLGRIVAKCRKGVAFRPGVVSDQRVPYGHVEADYPTANAHSEITFQLMMHNILIRDAVYEIQFSPLKDDVDGRCRHDDGHHGTYRSRQLVSEVLPLVYPQALTRVPWPAGFVKRNGVTWPTENVDVWEQFVAHVRAHDNKGRF